MKGGVAGMMADGTGTNGGWRGMNGAQRRIAFGFAAGFVLILALIMIANAESTQTDLAASGAHIRGDLVWSWEWTSMVGWLSLYPVLWVAVSRLRPPRWSWGMVAVAVVLGSSVASGWHIAVMVALRHVYYDAVGQGPYRFFGVLPGNRILYEYRKDAATYLQFIGLAAIAQWLIARAATLPAPARQMLAVSDGSVTHQVPLDEIDWIGSAANYVEIVWAHRTLLHRATLAAVEGKLGDAFVRIHRGRLVRRGAIRRIETDKSGDFIVELASGTIIRGSRRYRASLDALQTAR